MAFTRALIAAGKDDLLEDQALLAELRGGTVPDDDRVPVLVALSDNGPQMTSRHTAAFMAGARIAQHHGRPGTPNDQAWIESFFGHLKDENPQLNKIGDPYELEAELDACRLKYNTVRLHEGIGYVTPDDEHHRRGQAIRAARQAGLKQAHATRVATRRMLREDHPCPPVVGYFNSELAHLVRRTSPPGHALRDRTARGPRRTPGPDPHWSSRSSRIPWTAPDTP